MKEGNKKMKINNSVPESMYETAYFGKILCIRFELPKIGAVLDQHAHIKDHLSILASGSVSVQINDEDPVVYQAPHIIYVPKFVEHKIVSLSENTTWYCIFSSENLDEEEKEMINESQYPEVDEIEFAAGSIQMLYKKLKAVLAINKKLLSENRDLKKQLKLNLKEAGELK